MIGLDVGVFTDQAHDLILLSEDEARMLGPPVVDVHAAAIALWKEIASARARAIAS
jgi:hypothetical protein